MIANPAVAAAGVAVGRRRANGLEGFQPDVAAAPPLWETAVDTLRQAIIRGDLPAGVHLAEEEIATRLGVSRGPVRQALARVEHEGLVRILPRRGAVVLGFTDEDLHEIYEMRRLLEAHAARLAAQDTDPAALARLRELVDQVISSAESDQFHREVAYDLAVHRQLVVMANHRRLLAAWEPLTATVKALLTVTRVRAVGAAASHAEFVHAIESSDPETAAEAIIAHLDVAEQRLHAGRQAWAKQR